MSTPTPALCLNCQVLPAYTGHPFCGKSCAQLYVLNTPSPAISIPSSNSLCIGCGVRPQSPGHSYCGKTCAQNSAGSVSSSSPPNSSPVRPLNIFPTPLGTPIRLPARPLCNQCYVKHRRPNSDYCSNVCQNAFAFNLPIYSSPSSFNRTRSPLSPDGAAPICALPGRFHTPYQGSTFCCVSHHDEAVAGGHFTPRLSPPSHSVGSGDVCIYCGVSPPSWRSLFCSTTCEDQANSEAPCLLQLNSTHPKYLDVLNQFNTTWKHATPCPSVRHIYKVLSTPQVLGTYNAYRAKVEASRQFLALSRSAGNENRRWHGTDRACTLGDNPSSAKLCNNKACSLCCIIKESFDITAFARKTGWGRFGSGIYTSATSSKSNDYARNKGIISKYKAILLNNVVVGKGEKLTSDEPSRNAPSEGFDSVLGEKGGVLNHDELIVYTNDAIRPSFLVVYE